MQRYAFLFVAVTSLLVLLNCGARFNATDPEADVPAVADETQANDRVLQVAVIDISKVFKGCDAFNARMAQLKREVDSAEQPIREKADQLRQLNAELEQLQKGSDARINLTQRIAANRAALEADMARAKADFLKREADVYSQFYEKITDIVAAYARAHNIRLVVRHQHEPMNSDEPESVLKALNRMIVFQDGLDITDAVLKTLNSDSQELAAISQPYGECLTGTPASPMPCS